MNTDQIIDELEQLNYSAFDARRTTFMLVALAKGWQQATIARWLGVSKIRINQKSKALSERLARLKKTDPAEYKQYKALDQLMRNVATASPAHGDAIAFADHEWRSRAFAETCLAYLVQWKPGSTDPVPTVPVAK